MSDAHGPKSINWSGSYVAINRLIKRYFDGFDFFKFSNFVRFRKKRSQTFCLNQNTQYSCICNIINTFDKYLQKNATAFSIFSRCESEFKRCLYYGSSIGDIGDIWCHWNRTMISIENTRYRIYLSDDWEFISIIIWATETDLVYQKYDSINNYDYNSSCDREGLHYRLFPQYTPGEEVCLAACLFASQCIYRHHHIFDWI